MNTRESWYRQKFIAVGSDFNSYIIRLKLKNVWLTWVLIQKEGSWTFLRKEEKKEGSSLIYDIVFLIH